MYFNAWERAAVIRRSGSSHTSRDVDASGVPFGIRFSIPQLPHTSIAPYLEGRWTQARFGKFPYLNCPILAYFAEFGFMNDVRTRRMGSVHEFPVKVCRAGRHAKIMSLNAASWIFEISGACPHRSSEAGESNIAWPIASVGEFFSGLWVPCEKSRSVVSGIPLLCSQHAFVRASGHMVNPPNPPKSPDSLTPCAGSENGGVEARATSVLQAR